MRSVSTYFSSLAAALAFVCLGALVSAQETDSAQPADTHSESQAEQSAAHTGERQTEESDRHAEADSDESGDGHEADEHHWGGDSGELPNIIGLIFGHKPNPTITDIQYWENIIFALFGGLMLIIVARRVYTRRKIIPGPLQNFVELLVEYFYDFFHGILGSRTKRFLPFLGTLFFYILFMNLMGLIPFLKSPSTSINITASLAILVFFYSQYLGLKELGPVAWLDHLAGQPRDVVGWLLVPLMLPIHIIGEIAKPFSLAARLFGNITGEDVLIYAFVMLGISIMASFDIPVGLPLQAIFVPLGILLSTIQALVFTVLATIYISMMLPHEVEAKSGN